MRSEDGNMMPDSRLKGAENDTRTNVLLVAHKRKNEESNVRRRGDAYTQSRKKKKREKQTAHKEIGFLLFLWRIYRAMGPIISEEGPRHL